MSAKMHYPGSTHKCKPVAEIVGIQMVDERDPQRVNIIYNGTRAGTYMTSLNLDSSVELILKLEAVVIAEAAKVGYTHPALVRLIEGRRIGSRQVT